MAGFFTNTDPSNDSIANNYNASDPNVSGSQILSSQTGSTAANAQGAGFVPSSSQNNTYNIDPNSTSSITTGANQAIQSSAPPYNPLLSPNSPNANITSAVLQQYSQPGLTPSEQLQSQDINANAAGTHLTAPGQLGNLTQPTQQANASLAALPTQTAAGNYTATQTAGAQGTVDPMSMIQNQYESLMNSNKNAEGVPDWAQTAVTAANQRMNSLGLGASTMAGNATATAILNAALPMAAANAQVVAQLNSQNLNNTQQAMLSDAAWQNAAKQFNAQSEQQNNQFFASLTSQMASQNADRQTAISQFNAGQTNSMSQFVDNLNSQRQEFNTQNQVLVDQSNVQWQRAVNTANTAAFNAANQTNTMNMFNMSQTALNNLWQQARDEASWSLTAQENQQNRALSFVNSSLNRQTSLEILSSQLNANMFSQLGSLGVNLLNGQLGTALGKSLFGSSDNTGFTPLDSNIAPGNGAGTGINTDLTTGVTSDTPGGIPG